MFSNAEKYLGRFRTSLGFFLPAIVVLQCQGLSPATASKPLTGERRQTEIHSHPPPKGRPAPEGLALTEAESAWLTAHPQITIAINQAWPPMDYLDESGVPQGIGVDFIEAINRRLKGVLTLEPGPFKENLRRVKDILKSPLTRNGLWSR